MRQSFQFKKGADKRSETVAERIPDTSAFVQRAVQRLNLHFDVTVASIIDKVGIITIVDLLIWLRVHVVGHEAQRVSLLLWYVL
ncbi:MAG: hypothetical protein WBZ42_09110 [Halobacteriota archaeon]